MKYIKLRRELRKYVNEDLPVYRMRVSDEASGLLLTKRLVSGTFDDWKVEYVTPGRKSENNLPGVYLTSLSDGRVLCIVILTQDRNLEILANCEFAAKRILVDRVFRGPEDFNRCAAKLTLFEEWTYEEPFRKIFKSRLQA